MAGSIPNTRQAFKYYCMRSLGWPVIELNMEDDQVEDRITEALEHYMEFHMEGTELVYYKHAVTDVDKRNGYITLPENILGAVKVWPLSSFIGSRSDLFSIEYQIALESMYLWNNSSLIPYYMNRMYMELIQQLIVGEPMIRYNRHRDRLHIDWNWDKVNSPVIDSMATGTVSANSETQTLNGVGTSFLSTVAPGSHIALYNSANEYYIVKVDTVVTNTLLTLEEPAPFTNATATYASAIPGSYLLVEAYGVVDPEEFPDVWGDKWLQKYAIALIKRQWGNNTKKYGNMQLVGGNIFNGQQIYDEAIAEIKELEQEIYDTYSLPPLPMIG